MRLVDDGPTARQSSRRNDYREARQRILVARIIGEADPHLDGLALILGGHGVGLPCRSIDFSVGCGPGRSEPTGS